MGLHKRFLSDTSYENKKKASEIQKALKCELKMCGVQVLHKLLRIWKMEPDCIGTLKNWLFFIKNIKSTSFYQRACKSQCILYSNQRSSVVISSLNVLKAGESLKSNKARGIDGICPSYLVRYIGNSVLEYLYD